MRSASNMNTQTLTACIAISLVLGGVVSASAQLPRGRDEDRSGIGQQVQPRHQQPRQPEQRLGMDKDAQQPGMQESVPLRQVQPMARTSTLLGKEVYGQDGTKLGEVEEIVLSQDRRSVQHLAVSLDDGASVNVALNELFANRDNDEALMVRASKQELQQRQTQDGDQAARRQDEQGSRRVSKMIGMDVQGAEGKAVGSINDLIIDTQSGRIKTAAFNTGGVAGLGRHLASVEWSQVNFAANGDAPSIIMTREKLSERALTQEAFGEPDGQIQRRDDALQHRPGTTNVTTKVRDEGHNLHDRNEATLTPFDQGTSTADTEITAQLRRAINASEPMSLSGKNINIITRDGRVTLRGPVDGAEEKRLIGDIADRIASSGNVDNQLVVTSPASRSY